MPKAERNERRPEGGRESDARRRTTKPRQAPRRRDRADPRSGRRAATRRDREPRPVWESARSTGTSPTSSPCSTPWPCTSSTAPSRRAKRPSPSPPMRPTCCAATCTWLSTSASARSTSSTRSSTTPTGPSNDPEPSRSSTPWSAGPAATVTSARTPPPRTSPSPSFRAGRPLAVGLPAADERSLADRHLDIYLDGLLRLDQPDELSSSVIELLADPKTHLTWCEAENATAGRRGRIVDQLGGWYRVRARGSLVPARPRPRWRAGCAARWLRPTGPRRCRGLR